MPNRLKFYLDEMVSKDVASALRRRGVDVLTTHEAGNLSHSDEEQLSFARTEGRVLFTMDDDHLVLHNQGHEHSGIVYVAQNKKISTGEAVKFLWLVYEVLTPAEMEGHIEFF